jgi:23S rRNA pseudouridine1911/1915/1917 synthase
VAKTDLAHRRLGAAIAARRVRRTYAALCWGHLDGSPTVIEAPLARHPADRKRMAVVPAGRVARTDAFVAARFAVVDLLRLELHTGRTHQIRVHLEHIGHPVVGDPVYGGGGSRRISGPSRRAAEAIERATPRQALHAAALAFRHPASGEALEFRAEWPADLRAALLAAGGQDLVARDDPLGYLVFFNRDG